MKRGDVHIGIAFSACLLAAAPGCLAVDEDTELALAENHQAIVGGTAAQINNFPWQVSLQDTNGHFCGGSIIAPTWILTASHCVAEGAPTKIVAGISKLSQASSGQTRSVKRVISYPGYTNAEVGKDAALIELTSPLTLNGSTVAAIELLTSANAALANPGKMATVSGWGVLSTNGPETDQLMQVSVPVMTLAAARTSYGNTVTDDQLPAGYPAGGKDSCQGDSGGPLVVANGNGVLLAGIVSWGGACAAANSPGMYARVTSFVSWINGYVGGGSQPQPTGDDTVANAGPDFAVMPGARVEIDASASQGAGGGGIASFKWRQVSGATVSLQGATTDLVAFMAPQKVGKVELELTVTDDQGGTATDRVIVQFSADGSGPIDNGGSFNGDITGGCNAQRGNASWAMLVGMLLVAMRLPRRRRIA